MGVLESVWSYIETAFMFLQNLVASLLQAILILFNSLSLPVTVSSWVAPVIGSSVIVVGAIAIVKLLVGWGNS